MAVWPSMREFKTRAAPAAMAFAVLLGLLLRTYDLSRKPMHTDEAVQAAKAGILFEKNEYRYDPHEFHGPTLYYMAAPVLKFCAAGTWFVRIVSDGLGLPGTNTISRK